MAASRILIIQGHPDPSGEHFRHALGDSNADAATGAPREVRLLDVARLDFALLRSKRQVPRALAQAQQAIACAEHLVVIFPLWLGDMPALLDGCLAQVARPGFAIDVEARQGRRAA